MGACESHRRTTAGTILRRVGVVGIVSIPALAGGFWLADAGFRWMPDMLNVLLAVWLASLAAMIAAEAVVGRVRGSGGSGRRVRRGVVICLIVLVLGGVGLRLGVGWAQQPTSLTKMSAEQFDAAFELDCQRYREYDSALHSLVAAMESRTDLFDPTTVGVPTADQEQFLRSTWLAIYDTAFALDGIRAYYEDWYRFDPSRTERSYHVRSFVLTFAAELTLYETASRIVALLDANPNAMKFLDAPDGEGRLDAGSVSRFRRELQGTRDAARVVAGKQYLRWLAKVLSGKKTARATGCMWLWDKAEGELALIESLPITDLSVATVASDLQVLKRGVNRVWFPMQKGVSQWLGNTRVRRVGTYLITPDQQERMAARLAPGDILLSRKNWYLSNVGLPGFWPHAILHIGTPDELAAYFDDPVVREHLRTLAAGEPTLPEYLARTYPQQWKTYVAGIGGETIRVIEAIGPGVVLNTMRKASGDYMAALRPRLDKVAKAQAIIAAFSHVGKPYDFDFDFATDHVLVCTELVWRSYRPAEGKSGLSIPLVTVAGRRTLPANEIARLFAAEHGQPDAQLEFVYFLDAREETRSVLVSTEEAFLTTHRRSKWDVSQQ
jgi:hypothetical protein